MKKHFLCATILLYNSIAYALSDSELASLKSAVQEMCLFPDRTGEYLQTEGEIKAGAPVLVKIVKGELQARSLTKNGKEFQLRLISTRRIHVNAQSKY